jgi:hypothetical protein
MEPLTLLISVAAAITALGVICKAIHIVYVRIRKMDEMYHELMQMPAHRADMASFKEQTLHELNYNSGSSLKDMVRSTKTMLEDHVNDPDAHQENN